jgi:hypothetical protein
MRHYGRMELQPNALTTVEAQHKIGIISLFTQVDKCVLKILSLGVRNISNNSYDRLKVDQTILTY